MATAPGTRLSSVLLLLLLITPLVMAEDGGVGPMGTLENYTALNSGLPTTGDYFFIVLADVNGDGLRDIVASASNYSSRSTEVGLKVYTCKGGTSWEDNSSGLPTVDLYSGIGVADLDGDGDLDITSGIEANQGSSDAGIKVWLNNGTVGGKLSWTEGPTPSTRWQYCFVDAVDVNADGDPDIVASGKSGIGIHVYEGNGGAGGSLQWTERSTGLPTRYSYTGIVVADMNKDGHMDIVAADYQNSGTNVNLWTGDGKGNWTSRVSSLPSGSDLTLGITVGDYDLDGNMDIVYGTRDTKMCCLLGNGGGTDGASFCWTAADSGLPTTGGWASMTTGDVDKDGDPDVLAACTSRGLELYLSDGGVGGSLDWTKADVGLPTGRFYAAALGDIDRDRVLDVAGGLMADRNQGGLRAYLGTVTGESYPVSKAVWNGTQSNETTVVLGANVTADGRGSYDAEDAPGGDAAGTALVYDWNLTAVPAGSTLTDADLAPSDASATPSFEPDALGDYVLSLVVRDSDHHWSELQARLVLHVLKPNDTPVADAGADQVVLTGAPVELNGTASYDPDGTVVEWEWNASALNPVPVALAGNNTTVATFTAPSTTGLYAFTLRVRDDNGTWSEPDEVNVTVEPPANAPPVADAGVDVGARVGERVELDGSSSYDPDGAIVAWWWNCTSHPGLALENETTAVVAFVPSEAGTYNLTLTVQDDRGDWSPEDRVAVRVVAPDVNLPPVADISGGATLDARVGETVTLSGATSRDPDGTIVEWLWNCTSHPGVTISGQNTSSVSFVPSAPGYYSVTLAVKDDNGTWSLSEDTIGIRVGEHPNVHPVARIVGPTGVVRPGEQVELDGSTSSDSDGTIVEWLWSSTTHPSLDFTGQNTSAIACTPVEVGTYVFALRVIDDRGASSAQATLVFTVVAGNLRPEVSVLTPTAGDHTLVDGLLNVTWIATDPDGDVLDVTVEVLNGTTVIATSHHANPTNRTQLNATALGLPRNVTLTVRVTVTERTTAELLGATATSAPFRIFDPATVPPPPPPPPPPDGDGDGDVQEDGGMPWALIALIVLVVAGAIGVGMLMRSRAEAVSAPARTPAPGAFPVNACAECGGPLSTDNAFGRPYCARCDKYY